jgi:hypothetical protein
MNKEFISYEQALALKELGFDEPCLAYYKDIKGEKVLLDDSMDFDGEVKAPLKQQAFRWFRDKHEINPQITKTYYEGDFYIWDFYIPTTQYNEIPIRESSDNWNYEITESKCLDKLIEILKRK